MISELEFDTFDAEVDQLFRDASAEASESGRSTSEPDEERVERIVEKARHEAVIKDTTTFFFRCFAPALAELMGALLRALPGRSIDSGTAQESATAVTDPDADEPPPTSRI